MIPNIVYEKDQSAITIWPVTLADYTAWLATRNGEEQAWLNATGFEAEDGKFALLPGADGAIAGVVLGLGDGHGIWSFGDLSGALPAGSYFLQDDLAADIATNAVIAWSLGSYVFDQYKENKKTFAVLVAPTTADMDYAAAAIAGAYLARDLINSPAADMAPGDLAEAASELARKHGGKCHTLVGDELLMENFPECFHGIPPYG